LEIYIHACKIVIKSRLLLACCWWGKIPCRRRSDWTFYISFARRSPEQIWSIPNASSMRFRSDQRFHSSRKMKQQNYRVDSSATDSAKSTLYPSRFLYRITPISLPLISLAPDRTLSSSSRVSTKSFSLWSPCNLEIYDSTPLVCP